MCEALVPLMTHGGRIVNVSSTSGRLSIFPGPALRQQFEHPESAEQLDALAEKFPVDIEAGRHVAEGWPSSMYGVSKALETGRAEGEERRQEARGRDRQTGGRA